MNLEEMSDWPSLTWCLDTGYEIKSNMNYHETENAIAKQHVEYEKIKMELNRRIGQKTLRSFQKNERN